MKDVIRTHGLFAGYGKRVVVKDISFSVEAGKILTLIGPNGSGKSTILKSIAGQLGVLSGTVYFSGKSLRDMGDGEIAKQLSFVMTERVRPEFMSCREVVSTGRFPYTGRFGILTEKDREKVREAMTLVHADGLADEDFRKISDGQKQRVMLARAICQDTPVLILDEPTSFLDIRYKLDILTHIRQLAREKKTAVVMSLHELELAQKVSDYIACVEDGRIGKLAPPESVFCGDYIQRLYGIETMSFDPVLGIMNLQPNRNTPEYFVIGGGGAGIPVYQKLQRMNLPFAAGILGKNDMDYAAARATAGRLVCTEAFYPIGEKEIQQAKSWIDQCEKCICALTEFGPLNQGNRILRDYAADCGKLAGMNGI